MASARGYSEAARARRVAGLGVVRDLCLQFCQGLSTLMQLRLVFLGGQRSHLLTPHTKEGNFPDRVRCEVLTNDYCMKSKPNTNFKQLATPNEGRRQEHLRSTHPTRCLSMLVGMVSDLGRRGRQLLGRVRAQGETARKGMEPGSERCIASPERRATGRT